MKKNHVLLALAGTIGMSLVAMGLASCQSKSEAIDSLCSSDSLHFEVNKDTTLVPGETKGNYIIPRGEGTEDDIKFNVSAGNARTPFILNYTDSLFFVPNMNYYDDYFQLYFAISNLTHFRFEYYISENDDDNACTMEVSMYSRGSDPKHTFIDNSYTLKKGAGSYEWTRPDNVDPSKKAGLIFLMFDHFEGDPTFRFVKIEFDTSC